MGYAITIRRDDGDGISYAEWVEVARADAELVSGGLSEWKGPGTSPVRYQVFSWQRAGAPEDEGAADFVYYDGRITIDHVHDRWSAKIAKVAARLNARAVGDDGEVYDVRGNSSYPPRPEKPAWWKRWLGRE